MPDDIGRYSLLEIRTAVWRWLAAIHPQTVNSTSGEESFVVTVDQLFTKADVDLAVNQSITLHCVNFFADSPETLEDEEFINVVANQVEYSLPTDMAQLRGLDWKDPTDHENPPEWHEMFYVKNDEDIEEWLGVGPKYKLRLNLFVLDDPPTQDSFQGIRIRYIKWLLPLLQDEAYLETQFARLLQECVILDAAKSLASRKGFQVTADLRADLADAEAKLTIALRNAYAPNQVLFMPRHPFTKRATNRRLFWT